MERYLTPEGLTGALLTVYFLLQIYNTLMSARKSRREEAARQQAPTDALDERLSAHTRMLDNDKRTLDRHETELDRLRECTGYLCAGVDALLEHELHNGNADQMQQASVDLKQFYHSHL